MTKEEAEKLWELINEAEQAGLDKYKAATWHITVRQRLDAHIESIKERTKLLEKGSIK